MRQVFGLDVVCDFKKMRKLLAGCDAFALVREALDEAPGTTIVAVEESDEGAAPRLCRVCPLPEEIVALVDAAAERDGAATRTVEVRNVKRGADAVPTRPIRTGAERGSRAERPSAWRRLGLASREARGSDG